MRETKDSGVDWIGEVPVNWEIVPIKADVSIGHGSDPTTPGDIPVWGSGGEPFKTCGEHKNGPAVLLGRKGTLDCPQLVTGLYWNVDTAFDAKITSKKLSLKFFYYAATCVDIKPYMTVSDDRYDFVFTNNTGANIYIETQFVKVKGYWTSRFIIYGRPDPNGYTYKLDSQVVETIPLPDPTYEKDKTGEHVIYDDETQLKYKGREGYVVDVYLVTMDSNGLEISREKKYTDTYKAAAPIYYVGVTPRETLLPDTPSID